MMHLQGSTPTLYPIAASAGSASLLLNEDSKADHSVSNETHLPKPCSCTPEIVNLDTKHTFPHTTSNDLGVVASRRLV